MEKIKGTKGFSQLVDKGTSDQFHTKNLDVEDQTRFYVMEKLGTSLMHVFDISNQKLMKTDVLKVGIELLQLVEKLHSHNIIHQDIKFDNILLTKTIPNNRISKWYINSHFEKLDDIQRLAHHLMKNQQVEYQTEIVTSELNLVDFGLSQFLGDKYDSKFSIDSQVEINRNQFFSSKWVLKGHPYTKRDDVISIMYNLLFLMDPTHSWFAKFMTVPYKEAIKFKLAATNEEMCGGQRCGCLLPVYEEAYSYALNEEPNYGKMVHLLRKELMNIHCVPDRILSCLQADVKFYGYVVLQERENTKNQEFNANDIDEDCDVNEIEKYTVVKDNATFFKEASGKTKNAVWV